MCKYDFPNKKTNTKNQCGCPELFELAAINLPSDAEGLCIFHSSDLEWKGAHDFQGLFTKLFALTDRYAATKGSAYNFSGFIFPITGSTMTLDNQELKRGLDFSSAVFHEEFEIKNGNLMSVDVQHAIFKKSVKISSTQINGVFYGQNAIYNDSLFLADCTFGNFAFFSGSQFIPTNADAGPVLEIKRCQFSEAEFDHCNLEVRAHIIDSTFNSKLDFNYGKIQGEFIFRRNNVRDTLEFIGTQFLLQSDNNDHYSSVDFSQTVVASSGHIIFKGTEPFENMVTGTMATDFTFEEGGIISFENFNLNRIRQADKQGLLEREKSHGVQIGNGCRKYYCQSEVFHIDDVNYIQRFTLDLANIYCNFFESNSSLKLSVEILERNSVRLRYFYYTDSNISAEEFNSQLRRGEIQIWKTFAKLLIYKGETLQHRDLDIRDIMFDLSNLLIKVGYSISDRDTTEDQVRAIIGGATFHNHGIINLSALFQELKNKVNSLPTLNPNSIIFMGDINIKGDNHSFQTVTGDVHNNNYHTAVNSEIEKLNVSTEQKAVVKNKIEEIKAEPETTRKESKLSELIKEYFPTIADAIGRVIRPYVGLD